MASRRLTELDRDVERDLEGKRTKDAEQQRRNKFRDYGLVLDDDVWIVWGGPTETLDPRGDVGLEADAGCPTLQERIQRELGHRDDLEGTRGKVTDHGVALLTDSSLKWKKQLLWTGDTYFIIRKLAYPPLRCTMCGEPRVTGGTPNCRRCKKPLEAVKGWAGVRGTKPPPSAITYPLPVA